MNLPKAAVNRPVSTVMVFLAILLIGLVSITRIPIDLFPEIQPPVVNIITSYPGAGSEDVERNVTEPIEQVLATVSDLDEMRSTSEDNVSQITMEFDWGVDLDAASNDIRDQLELAVNELPDDAETPILFKLNSGLFPVLIASFTAEETYNELNELIDEEVGDAVRRLPGVGTVGVGGGPQREIQVEIDPQRLEAYNLSLADVNEIITAENSNVPAGRLEMGLSDYNVRVPAEFTSVEQINDVVLARQNGEVIYLRDVATVRDDYQDMTQVVRLNEQNSVSFIVQKQSGANTVTVAQNAIETVEEQLDNLPEDVNFHVISDGSEFILNSVGNLSTSIIMGAVFVVVVVLIFLQRLNATFIVATVLPASLIGAFIFLNATGNSLNVISLSSLAIALGMVVDDAIVILENITTHIERGSRVSEAAVYGSSEVGLAVFATTMAVVAVFLPLAFLTGIAGVLFSQLGYLVTITVVVSTFAALTLIPMLAARYFEPIEVQREKKSRFDGIRNKMERALNRLNRWYKYSLVRVLTYRGTLLIVSGLLFVGSFFLIPFLGVEFMPQSDSGEMEMTVELDAGLHLDETLKVTRRIEDQIQEEYPEILEMIQAEAGVSNEGGVSALFTDLAGSNIVNFTLRFIPKDERDQSINEIAEDIRELVSATPGLFRLSVDASGSGGMQAGSPIEVQLRSNDMNVTLPLARALADSARQIPGTRDVQVSVRPERPEIVVRPDRDKIAQLGLNSGVIASTLNGAIQGYTTTQYREGGEEYDIRVRTPEEYRNSITELQNLPIQTVNGQIVRLNEVATIEQGYISPQIERIDQERVVSVTSDNFNRSIGEITGEINEIIASMDIPRDVEVTFGGDVEQQQESFNDLLLLMALSIFLVYIVMASQFENYKDPFIIMFSIPFSFVGVFVSLFVTGFTLSVIALLGSIILIGIVVKNAIVLVDYLNIFKARGMTLRTAIIEGSTDRLRPVLMTAFTTMLAMLPLALSTGEGAETWQPLGIAVVGGLVFSTFITMYIVPVIYSYMQKEELAE